MTDFANAPIAEAIADAHALYSGVEGNPEIAAALAEYGYEPDDIEAGLDMVEDAEVQQGTQATEYAEQYAATAVAIAALATLEALYARHRKLARLKNRRGTDGYRALGLTGRIPEAGAARLAAASTFYRALQANPALYAGIRGLDKKGVEDGLARVAAARAAMSAQTKETGEAQRATALRDDAVARLRAHASELAQVARIALADRPQLRESLGLIERGS